MTEPIDGRIDELDTAWDHGWGIAADRGQCDALGGAEYRRVRAAWVAAGRPAGIAAFIRLRANICGFPPELPHDDSPGSKIS